MSIKVWRRAALAMSLFAAVALAAACFIWYTTSANARAVEAAKVRVGAFQYDRRVEAQNSLSAASVRRGTAPADTRPYVAPNWPALIPRVMPSVVALASVDRPSGLADHDRLWALPGVRRNLATRLLTRFQAWQEDSSADADDAQIPSYVRCAGIVIGEHQVLTAAHCVVDETAIRVRTASGEWRGVHVLGADVAQDVAVLFVEGEPLTPIAIAPMAPLQGQDVLSIGSPGGYGFSVGTGVVARYGEEAGPFAPNTIMLVTATIAHGDSGGVIVNSRGEAVSLISCQFESYSLTVPIHRAMRVAAELEQRHVQ